MIQFNYLDLGTGAVPEEGGMWRWRRGGECRCPHGEARLWLPRGAPGYKAVTLAEVTAALNAVGTADPPSPASLLGAEAFSPKAPRQEPREAAAEPQTLDLGA